MRLQIPDYNQNTLGPNYYWLFSFAYLVISLSCVAQDESQKGANIQQLTSLTPSLAQFSEIPLLVPPFGFFGQPQCNTSHSMFFEASIPPQVNSTYLSISEDGKKQAVYELPKNVLEDRHDTFFYAGNDGVFYLLTRKLGASLQLFSFEDNGHLVNALTLDTPKNVIPEGFAVNSDGDLLLMAYNPTTDQDNNDRKPQQATTYRAIFNRAGSLVSTLATTHTTVNESGVVDDSSLSLVRSEGRKFYWLSGDTLFVASARGNVMSKMKINRPESESFIGGFIISGNMVEVTFRTPSSHMTLDNSYALLNIDSGELYGMYVAPEGPPMQLACFDSKEGFTFIAYKKEHLSLVKALLPYPQMKLQVSPSAPAYK